MPPITPYSVVIATLDRPRRLRDALASLASQSFPPARVVVVDASSGDASRTTCDSLAGRLRISHQRACRRSAAAQRNQGSEAVDTPLIAFIDDDVVLDGDVFEKLADAIDDPSVGGVAARERGCRHVRPSPAARLFYRLQAGFRDETYGGRLFGSAVACVPTYEEPATRDLIPGDWLPSGCLLLRTQAFRVAGGFPEFEGYSALEDVHLTATIARHHRLLYHVDAWFDHFPSMNAAKSDRFAIGRMRMANRRRVAREVLEVNFVTLEAKLLLHRLFDTLVLLRARPRGWRGEILGTWCG